MKRVFIVLICLAVSGCVTTTVTKEVQVKKDANGKIIETVEIERTIQQGSTRGMQFDYLKAKESDRTPTSIFY